MYILNRQRGYKVNILSVKSSQETQALANELAALLHPGTVILLDGPLGSGKTTFTQGLGKALGVKRAIKSPTYTIVKEYSIEGELMKSCFKKILNFERITKKIFQYGKRR